MADPILHNLHPSDIALQDTASYNQWFNTIVELRNKAQTATDSTDKAIFTQAMNDIVVKMETDLSDDTTMVDIGPMLDMWEVEGGRSFGAFADQMFQEETEDAFQAIVQSSNFDLSGEQTQVALEGLKKDHTAMVTARQDLDQFNSFVEQSKAKMGSIWDRYEALRDADPDRDFLGESRFVWWGMATPDNPIQEEIAQLGQAYRQLDAGTKNVANSAVMPVIADRAQKDFTSALEALQNLQGE